ncbi:metallophosphoesterase family protein [Peribacillus kribbensis]|uniref:metallophosphoesterase family protein n=1 Tax=Peribacillus kribbensis TaxID=356658 RepID=UPI0003FD6FDD|nr:DNA repair exonuclease [Peribacillus kribbensis]
MGEIKFIHTADLHLDSPFTGIKDIPDPIIGRLREAAFLAFERIVTAAISRQVDFVLISGDIYDGENRSIRAQVRFRKEMERLSAQHIPVYVIHGNHDHLSGSWVKLDFPPNVHIYKGEPEVKFLETADGARVQIYGFSYPERHVFERMAARYTKSGGADFHIAMLHGNLEGSSEHGNYAPFTLEELLEKDMDYWALGHIHKRQELYDYPGIIYPGNIQGRHKNEQGDKGCYLIKLSEGHMERHFIETSDIIWETAQLEVDEFQGFDDLLDVCREQVMLAGRPGKGVFLEIRIELKAKGLETREISDGILEILQEEYLDDDFVWVHSLKIQTRETAVYEESNPFIQELLSISKGEAFEMEAAAAALFKHPQARKYLDLDNMAADEILDRSTRLVLELLNGGAK